MNVKCRNLSVTAILDEPTLYTPSAMNYVRERTNQDYTDVEIANLLRWGLNTLHDRARRHGIALNLADTSST